LNSVPKVAIRAVVHHWFGTGADRKIAIAIPESRFSAIVIDPALGTSYSVAAVSSIWQRLCGGRG